MTAAADTLLELEGLSKSYPGVKALSEVGLELRTGEVHALVGENGAGKSTLSKIVAGLEKPTSGTMSLRGRPYDPPDKAAAEGLGVRIVMQELHLVETLTVAENIFLRCMPRRLGWIAYRRMNAQAADLMARLGLGAVDPRRRVGELGVGQQQLVEIAIGLSQQCRVLILDEPTAALTDAERELLFTRIADLKGAGVGILYISHRMEEIGRIADRVTVLRDGKVVATAPAGGLSAGQIIRWMVGRELSAAHPPRERQAGAVAMSVRGLRARPAVREVSFDLHQGEILGLAGLMGSGRTETVRAIFGADIAEAGEVRLGGSERPARIASPADAVRQGVALLTEDRKEQGLLLPLSVQVNVTLARLRDISAPGGLVRPRRERADARRLIESLSVRCRRLDEPVWQLSGGNQQKVVLARWLYRDCRVLMFDEPTRGIDVGTKFGIYQLLADLAGRGKAILLVSSDLEELLAVCDRIAVMSAGRLVRVFPRGQWSQDAIMTAALSGYEGAAAGACPA